MARQEIVKLTFEVECYNERVIRRRYGHPYTLYTHVSHL